MCNTLHPPHDVSTMPRSQTLPSLPLVESPVCSPGRREDDARLCYVVSCHAIAAQADTFRNHMATRIVVP